MTKKFLIREWERAQKRAVTPNCKMQCSGCGAKSFGGGGFAMKIRIKFAKTGVMKFVGHLDVMRYFQKAIRRAELPIAYSEGFSPRMLLSSFASPLGVGISSTGEYFDMVLAEDTKKPTRL